MKPRTKKILGWGAAILAGVFLYKKFKGGATVTADAKPATGLQTIQNDKAAQGVISKSVTAYVKNGTDKTMGLLKAFTNSFAAIKSTPKSAGADYATFWGKYPLKDILDYVSKNYSKYKL
jgi:hypothetical protein